MLKKLDQDQPEQLRLQLLKHKPQLNQVQVKENYQDKIEEISKMPQKQKQRKQLKKNENHI